MATMMCRNDVVVASPIASYIIKLVVVIDCCPPIYKGDKSS